MKLITVFVFESVDELIDYTRIQPSDGSLVGQEPNRRSLPYGSKLVFENDMKGVRLEAKGFQLGDKVTVLSVIKALCNEIGLGVYIT